MAREVTARRPARRAGAGARSRGTWKDLTDSVNMMAGNLTAQVRNIAEVTTAVANGDLSKKITVDVRGEILELKATINTMVDQLNSFASEVTRWRVRWAPMASSGQAQVRGISGTWKDLTDNVNSMAANLTDQVRGIAKVVTAVANGDLKQKLTVEAKGEIAELGDTINSMTDTLATFAEQVTTVAREVGSKEVRRASKRAGSRRYLAIPDRQRQPPRRQPDHAGTCHRWRWPPRSRKGICRDPSRLKRPARSRPSRTTSTR